MSNEVNLQRVQTIFDRRAKLVSTVDFLPREIARRMQARLDYIITAPLRVLDIGCGLGEDWSHLHARFPHAALIALDLSAEMLRHALQRVCVPWWQQGWHALLDLIGLSTPCQPNVVQTDFAALPFASNSFGLLWSNLALQWRQLPQHIFEEWGRVLQAGGLLMFSTLGPDTLRELRAAWRLADNALPRAHVIDFTDMHIVGDLLLSAGFEAPVMDMEMITVTYPSPQALLQDVRRWGAYPFCDASRCNGLTGRRTYQRLIHALEAQRRTEDGTIPLTFEVIYGHAWKTLPKTTSQGHQIIRVEHIGRVASSTAKS